MHLYWMTTIRRTGAIHCEMKVQALVLAGLQEVPVYGNNFTIVVGSNTK
jgi:hypothetical protein